MYDSIYFRLRSENVPNTDFLAETSCYFNITGEHKFNNEVVLSGNLGGLKISVNEDSVSMKKGSLCKWFLGNNIKSLGCLDTKHAIEKLSDTLHLPMDKAYVRQIDVAHTFSVKYPVDVYYNHLGGADGYKRMSISFEGLDEGLYYECKGQKKILSFYNKLLEQMENDVLIPKRYQKDNWLRYEQRYKGKFSKVFGLSPITVSMLYDKTFYENIVRKWREDYQAIQKINDISLNFEEVRGKRDLYTMGTLSLIEQQGGLLAFLSQIKEAQQMGLFNKKQAFDIRKIVNDSCMLKTGFTVQNECIIELDEKIDEAVDYYLSTACSRYIH